MLVPTQPPKQSAPNALLRALLDSSHTGIVQLRPLYAAGQPAEVADLAYVRLNHAAQHLLNLPEHPTGTLLELAPHEQALFAFYRDTFCAGHAGYHDYYHEPLHGPSTLLHVAAQREGELLVVSLTEARSDRPAPTSPLPPARPTSLVAARLAQEVLAQTLTAVCLLRGPEFRIEYTNAAFDQLFPNRQLAAGQWPRPCPKYSKRT